jgi:hypothetical protein
MVKTSVGNKNEGYHFKNQKKEKEVVFPDKSKNMSHNYPSTGTPAKPGFYLIRKVNL